MRCCCCDVILTPQESTRKFKESLTYTDMCTKCLKTIDVPTIEGKANHEEEDDESWQNL